MAAFSKPFMGRKIAKKKTAGGSKPARLSADIGYDCRRRMGAYLQELRVEKGLTQAELGALLGIGNTGVSSIEHGRTSLTPLRRARRRDASRSSHRCSRCHETDRCGPRGVREFH